MKLKEYMCYLQTVVKHFPEALEYEVVYSSDSEGNSFEAVYYNPTIGFACDGEFIAENDFEDYQENYDEPLKSNAVCIN